MTLELIAFIASILFGITLYWKESHGNGLYRFFNKLLNSKELQMKDTNTKGFVFQQTFLLRLVFISTFFLLVILLFRFLIPIDLATISLFASLIFGTLLGTYISAFVFKSSEVIEEQTENIEEKIEDVIEKGKDFVKDLEFNENEKELPKPQNKVEEKSARERLKDKGLL